MNLRQSQQNKQRAEKITRNKNSDFYSIKNAKSSRAEIFIFDEIGFFGITAQNFIDDLKEIEAKDIDLRINSPGGAVFEGMAIYNAIKRHPANITVHIEALAASISAVIAMAGDEIRMAENSHLMIHNAFTLSIGNSDELRKDADLLDRIDKTIAQVFANKSGVSIDEILGLMGETTWFLADEAKEAGLIDIVEGETEVENHFDLTIFNNCPEDLICEQGKAKSEDKFSPKAVERALRDVGYTVKEAKTAVARCSGGGDSRDVDLHNEMKSLLKSVKS